MKNITLSLPDDLYERVKAAAHEKKTSVNGYVNVLLAAKLTMSPQEWLDNHYVHIQEFKVSYGKKITREEIYEED
ncbi:MAG: hypothetical protein WCK51_10915 [Armatimonadota bacterium]